MRYCFQTAAWVWVPWPRVASEMGMQDELGVGHRRDHLFGDAQFGRVDEVVGGVDPEDRRGDGGRAWARGCSCARR